MSDSNVGLGMVPCRPGCRCDECTIERQAGQIRELKAEVAGWKRAYDVDCSRLIERAKAAEAEVARLKERNSCAACQDENTRLVSENASLSANFNGVCHKRDHWKACAEAAEAKLRAVGRDLIKLADYWESIQFGSDWWTTMQFCIKGLRDELEALLKKEGAL